MCKTLITLHILELIVTKPVSKKKSGLDEALEDVKASRVSEYASVDDFFNQMGL